MSPLEVSQFHVPYLQLKEPIDFVVNLFSQLWMYVFIIAIAITLYFLQPKRSTLMKGG
jgi:hypothetical protein